MITAVRPAQRQVPWQIPLVLTLLALPLVILFWLLANPSMNMQMIMPIEHFVIVTNVSLVAAAVALLLARGALQLAQYRMLLPALGFMSLGGLFWVHALATPGVIMSGTYTYSNPMTPSAIVGISAVLSLFVPSLFFATRYLPLAAMLERREPDQIRRWLATITVGLVVLLVLYAIISIRSHEFIEQLPLSHPPISYGFSLVTVSLLLFAAWNEGQAYLRTSLPMQGALVVGYILLAEANIAMTLGPTWTLAWAEYHVLMLGAVVIALAALFVELERRRGLEQFLPTTIVERVLASGAPRLAGERRTVTILFADMRGSTALAERLPADEIVELLNTYLGLLTRCVFDRGGVLDKFTGDGLMATFGLSNSRTDGAIAAAQTAIEIRESLAALNAERAERGAVTAHFGMGINTGEVTLGLVGIPQRAEYMAIGDTVNTAARLESLCKQLDVDNVLSAETAARLQQTPLKVRSLGLVTVAGKSHPVEAYTLV